MSDPTLAVAALVATIGLADSVNPSTIAPATALAMREDGARRAAAFAAGVALVSLLGGVVLVAGPGKAIVAALPHPGALAVAIGEVVAGAVLLALAAAAWACRRRIARRLSQPAGRRTGAAGLGGAFALGAGIMAVELPTAFPYFGAVAAIVGSHAPLTQQLLLVVVFNAAFVLPLAAIVGVRLAAGDRATARLADLRERLARHAGAALAALLAAGGTVLVAVGLA